MVGRNASLCVLQQVLDPADMVNPKVDELSVMTYISYFPEAKCKPGAPLRPRVHPSAKCYATGPGVEPKGLVCKKRAEFTVFTQGAGMGKLGVQVWGPGKKEVEVFVQDNNDHTFSCYYIPAGVGKLSENEAIFHQPSQNQVVGSSLSRLLEVSSQRAP